ncbi:hypothetical protein THAOC_27320 [Thalassiosira oceanica]|uniref:Uncharacterized protein n=1 Tax=Thalassiosira oceanica TaxID=159749 RepID=K0RWR6_THAOC|nr:hypothetical protein THAOC_27320 [Thalassiosira oceanica]|eukprot:EJK53276.1 hypothetical protein THAOC_27320 [Thalassiosira oceanica]
MKLAIIAACVASAAAFAPMAPVRQATSLDYSVKVFNEEEGIDATFECADDVFIVGESIIPRSTPFGGPFGEGRMSGAA